VFIIRSLLRLVTKYDAPALRQQVLSGFQEAFPAAPAEDFFRIWMTSTPKRHQLSESSNLDPPEVAIVVANMAEELELPVVRPCAIWYCAFVLSWRTVNQGWTYQEKHLDLSPTLKRDVFEARFKILSIFQSVFKQWTGLSDDWSVNSCATRTRCRDTAVKLSLAWHDPTQAQDSIYIGGWDDGYLTVFDGGFCDVCRSSFGKGYESARQTTWQIAPSFAGFADWDEVLKKAN
jgi:hypothetical protein